MQKSSSFATKCSITIIQCILLLLIELVLLAYYGEFDSLLAAHDAISAAVAIDSIIPMTNSILSTLSVFVIHLLFVIYNFILFTALSDSYKNNFIYTDRKHRKIQLFINSTILLFINYFFILIINNATNPDFLFAFNKFITNHSILNFFNHLYIYIFAVIWLVITGIICLFIIMKKYFKSNQILLVITLSILGIILYNKLFTIPVSSTTASHTKAHVALLNLDYLRYNQINKYSSDTNTDWPINNYSYTEQKTLLK
jgi:hypothetical protein